MNVHNEIISKSFRDQNELDRTSHFQKNFTKTDSQKRLRRKQKRNIGSDSHNNNDKNISMQSTATMFLKEGRKVTEEFKMNDDHMGQKNNYRYSTFIDIRPWTSLTLSPLTCSSNDKLEDNSRRLREKIKKERKNYSNNSSRISKSKNEDDNDGDKSRIKKIMIEIEQVLSKPNETTMKIPTLQRMPTQKTTNVAVSTLQEKGKVMENRKYTNKKSRRQNLQKRYSTGNIYSSCENKKTRKRKVKKRHSTGDITLCYADNQRCRAFRENRVGVKNGSKMEKLVIEIEQILAESNGISNTPLPKTFLHRMATQKTSNVMKCPKLRKDLVK